MLYALMLQSYIYVILDNCYISLLGDNNGIFFHVHLNVMENYKKNYSTFNFNNYLNRN